MKGFEWTHTATDRYLVTGYLAFSTKRFRSVYSNPYQALAINLWRGRVYLLRGGKRIVVKVVTN